MGTYKADGWRVVLAFPNGERELRAECTDCGIAVIAADKLNKAGFLNDRKRQYTAAARLIAEVEALPGFKWTD